MQDIIYRIKELQEISESLEPKESERNASMDQVWDFSNNFINNLAYVKTFENNHPRKDRFKIDGKAKGLHQILEVYRDEVASKGICAASGGHLGYIPGGGLFGSALGDFLADITNEYAGVSYASPGAVQMENGLIRWMCSIFGYPETAIGNLTSGGSIANLIALTTARDRHKIKGSRIHKSVIYISQQTHHCILKALKIIGLEDIQLRYIELDHFFRMKPDHLSSSIQKDINMGFMPFMIVASAGTTDTGAIDPLNSLADIANKNKLWFHVDAAYGGFFILTDAKKDKFKGIERSDSLVIDPHKGLFLPYGSGAVLIKDKKAALKSHQLSANYMQDVDVVEEDVSPADVSPELSRHFRGMRMWLPLQLHGLKPFKACLEEKLLLTLHSRELLLKAGFRIGPEPDLSVTYFWYEPKRMDSNAFNKALLHRIHEDGQFFMSSTLIENLFVIRLAIFSFRTKLREIDLAIETVRKCLSLTLEDLEHQK